MREPIRDKGRLEHMLEAIDNVHEFTKDITFEGLAGNKMLRHAVTHNIQIIGEAAYKLTSEFCASHTDSTMERHHRVAACAGARLLQDRHS